MYDVYATKAELAEYLSVVAESLPADVDRLLKRASELVYQMMKNNYDETDPDHIEAASMATCAQVEEWLMVGETKAIVGSVKDFSLGPLKMNLSGNSGQIATRAYNYLLSAGLLYAGRRIGSKYSKDTGDCL